MDSTEEKQKQRGPIDVLNDFASGASNFLGKKGVFTKAGLQAAKGALAIIPFWVWLVLGIVILAGIVFIIVASGAAPGAPSQSFTPTPAP